MTQYLLLDFGTSRVKSAIVDLDTGEISHIVSRSAPATPDETGAIPISLLQAQFDSICREYLEIKGIPFSGIMLSCQMHGFAVLTEDYRPVSGYITWRDERSLTMINGESAWNLFNQNFGARFRQISGMKPRPGFPVFNLLHMARQGSLPKRSLVASLAEVLCLGSGDFAGVTHPTMVAGLGLYDIERQRESTDILDFIADESGVRVVLPAVVDERCCAGYWHNQTGDKIPIYVGVGDHQCTVLGAENLPAQTLSINMGTGSQVAAIDFAATSEQVEQRPYFGNGMLSTITHIPAGRALETYVGFLADVANVVADPKDAFWKMLAEVKPAAILQETLTMELGIFSSAWGYQGGGAIRNINEGVLTPQRYLAALLQGLCRQYQTAAQFIDPQGKLTQCVLSGGIPQKLPHLLIVLAELLQREIRQSGTMDESLIGLRTLALVADGRASDYRAAQNLHKNN